MSSLVNEGTQYKPLKVDLRYHRTGYTGGLILFRNVPGFATCPRTCFIHRCLVLGLVQLRGFSTDYRREPWGLERPRPSPIFFPDPGYFSGKFRRVGRSSSQRPFQLARARPRVCVPECNTICAFQHAMAVYPPSMVARHLYRCVHASQTPIWVIQGPSAVRARLVPSLYDRSAS